MREYVPRSFLTVQHHLLQPMKLRRPCLAPHQALRQAKVQSQLSNNSAPIALSVLVQHL